MGVLTLTYSSMLNHKYILKMRGKQLECKKWWDKCKKHKDKDKLNNKIKIKEILMLIRKWGWTEIKIEITTIGITREDQIKINRIIKDFLKFHPNIQGQILVAINKHQKQ